MKTLILSINILAVGLVYAVDIIVPKTDDRTLLREPLDEGRLAYKDCGENAACLFIGQKDNPVQLTVTDPCALRGYRTSVLAIGEYSVTWTGGFTYDGVNDKYTLNNTLNVTNRIVFTALGNRRISDAKYEEVNEIPGRIGTVPCAYVTKTVTDNQVIVEVCKHTAGNYWIQFPVIYGIIEGSNFDYIDLNDLHIKVIDTIGGSELCNWRAWARDIYNGNRGEDWSNYKAKGNMYMLDHKIVFGPTNEFVNSVVVGQAKDNDSAIEFTSNGSDAMWIGPAPSSSVIPSGAVISNIAFGVTNTTVYITIKTFNFPGFDIGKMKLLWTPTIEASSKNFSEVAFTYTGSNPYLLQTPKVGDSGFFVCKYGSASAYIEVKCPMKVHELRLIGTDNKIYRISVTAGVISATEITE